jgi:hypothetical protein
MVRGQHDRVDGVLQRVAAPHTPLERQHDQQNATVSSQLGDIYEEFSRSVSDFTGIMKEQYQELSSQLVAKKDLSDLFANLSGSLATAIAQGESQSHSHPPEKHDNNDT